MDIDNGVGNDYRSGGGLGGGGQRGGNGDNYNSINKQKKEMPINIIPKNTKCINSTFSKFTKKNILKPENYLILKSLKKLNFIIIRPSVTMLELIFSQFFWWLP